MRALGTQASRRELHDASHEPTGSPATGTPTPAVRFYVVARPSAVVQARPIAFGPVISARSTSAPQGWPLPGHLRGAAPAVTRGKGAAPTALAMLWPITGMGGRGRRRQTFGGAARRSQSRYPIPAPWRCGLLRKKVGGSRGVRCLPASGSETWVWTPCSKMRIQTCPR